MNMTYFVFSRMNLFFHFFRHQLKSGISFYETQIGDSWIPLLITGSCEISTYKFGLTGSLMFSVLSTISYIIVCQTVAIGVNNNPVLI